MAVNQSKENLRKQRLKQEENRKKVEEASAKARIIFLSLFGGILLISIITLIVTLITDAVYVHNTSMVEQGGREVGVSGAAFLKALFTGTYTSSAAGYDDIALPFYYYAKDWCAPAAVFLLFSMIATIGTMILSAISLYFAISKKDSLFPLFSLIATTLTTIFLIAVYAICLSMSGSQILPVYCSGNPACSIRSDAIWGVLLSIVMLAGSVFAALMSIKMRKMRKTLA